MAEEKRLTREELFLSLRGMYTGTEEHSILSGCEKLSPDEGLKYVEPLFRDACKHVRFPNRYRWDLDPYVTFFKILLAIFKALKAGIKDFPPLPKIYDGVGCDSDMQALQDWANGVSAYKSAD